MIRDAKNMLVRELRSDVDVFTVTNGRVYTQDVATILNPAYPCATVSFGGGIPDEFLIDLASALVNIRTYSTKSYDQCWDIYEKIKTALAFGVFTDADVRIRVTESTLPIERYDSVSRIYNVVSGWDITIIGT